MTFDPKARARQWLRSHEGNWDISAREKNHIASLAALLEEAVQSGKDAGMSAERAKSAGIRQQLHDAALRLGRCYGILADVVDAANQARRESDPNYYEPNYVKSARDAIRERGR